MKDIPDFDIRYTYPSDGPYLKQWLLSPGILHWFPLATEKEVSDAVSIWMGFCRFSSSITAVIDQTPCGIATLFLMPYRKIRHHCLFKIIVNPKHQRQGIGSALIKNVKHLAKNYFNLEIIHIEVFENNPLILLLEKFGFKEFARQERYVKEDGAYLTRILMECNLD